MSITPEQIQSTAQLARLKLDAESLGEVTERIAGILDLVDQMQAVDTSDVEPMANPHDAAQRLRPDQAVYADNAIAERDRFQTIAPATDQGLYLVPKVIE